MRWSGNARVIHGMQEARGSSPLSSTALQKQISNTEPMVLIAVEGQNEGQALGWLTSAAPGDGGVCPAVAGFGSAQEVMGLRVRTYVRALGASLDIMLHSGRLSARMVAAAGRVAPEDGQHAGPKPR